eukprot:CAMPEP_0118868422 /NCGR_PEP_ID=MMETSP1163-20130328/11909_1 /TAXON_ID=124430 /ORGANISM="Phaeomonas parva, Strain CCMP2877" /LENGTH=93 /DNA_ID=CAMNT_0006803097 /DNA_START=11 /DNA_END=292 /DNA_ORIENTATION=-
MNVENEDEAKEDEEEAETQEAEAGIHALVEWPGVEKRLKELKEYAASAGAGSEAAELLERFQHVAWVKHVAKKTSQPSIVSFFGVDGNQTVEL